MKNLNQREWHFYPLLWPLGTDQPALPPPPTKETREVKESPISYPSQLTKGFVSLP